MSARDRRVFYNTMTCLLKGLEGKVTTVELRNEATVHGSVTYVDSTMNVHVANAVFTMPDGKRSHFDKFYIQGKNIRYVQIPDDINIIETMKQQLDQFGRVSRYTERAKKLTAEEKKIAIKQTKKDKLNKAVENMKKQLNMT